MCGYTQAFEYQSSVCFVFAYSKTLLTLLRSEQLLHSDSQCIASCIKHTFSSLVWLDMFIIFNFMIVSTWFQRHKWELLERYPVLLLTRKTTDGFVVDCLCPWQMDMEDTKDALVTIKRIYEGLLNGNVHKCSCHISTQSRINLKRRNDRHLYSKAKLIFTL